MSKTKNQTHKGALSALATSRKNINMNTNSTTLTKPADLDPSRLHPPAVVREWKAKVAAYNEALREQEEAKQRAKDLAEMPRYLDDDAYYEMAVKREEALKAKAQERERAVEERHRQEADYLLSNPDIAQINDWSEYGLLMKLQHWLSRGYTVQEDSVHLWLPGAYAVKLAAPSQDALPMH